MADATFQGMLNPRHRVPQIQWKRNKTHGIILCLLFRYFEKDNKAFERIFSAIFQNELWEYGFTSGVLFNRLNSQLVQMRKDEHAVWSDVFETPFDKNGPWSGFLRLIQDTATSSGIELKEKEDVITTSGYFLSPPQDTSPDENTAEYLPGYSPECAIDSEFVDTLQDVLEHTNVHITEHTMPVEAQTHSEAGIIGLIAENEQVEHIDTQDPYESASEASDFALFSEDEPVMKTSRLCEGERCIFCYREGLLFPETRQLQEHKPDLKQYPGSDELPPLLYRWSNIDSAGINSKQMLIAGLFASDSRIKLIEEYSPEEFKNLVIRHIRIEKAPTPFISTFITPLPTIHRALNKQEGAIITIIDPSKVRTPIYSARGLVYGMNIRQRKYDGRGEFLIWGAVSHEAIVATFKISDFERIAAENADIGDILQVDQIRKSTGKRLRSILATGPGRLDYPSGATIGKLLRLLSIPKTYAGQFATNITRSWIINRGSREEFMAGLDAGLASTPSPSPAPSPSLFPTPASIAQSNIIDLEESAGDDSDDDIVLLPRKRLRFV